MICLLTRFILYFRSLVNNPLSTEINSSRLLLSARYWKKIQSHDHNGVHPLAVENTWLQLEEGRMRPGKIPEKFTLPWVVLLRQSHYQQNKQDRKTRLVKKAKGFQAFWEGWEACPGTCCKGSSLINQDPLSLSTQFHCFEVVYKSNRMFNLHSIGSEIDQNVHWAKSETRVSWKTLQW